MSRETSYTTERLRDELDQTALVFHPLEEQYRTLEDQHEAAALGMWVFLATEVLFFGVLFFGVAVYHVMHSDAVEKASAKLNWMVGGINTVVLLVSSLFMVLAVHYAKLGRRKHLMAFLALTASLGVAFLLLKGFEYYTDYRDNLIPGWRFDKNEWIDPKYRPANEPPPKEQKADLRPGQEPHVELFLLFYWIMTGLHAVHVTVGVVVVLVMLALAGPGPSRRPTTPRWT